MKRRQFSTLAIAAAFGLGGLVSSSPVRAEVKPFDAAAFAAAQDAGASVLVAIHASW